MVVRSVPTENVFGSLQNSGPRQPTQYLRTVILRTCHYTATACWPAINLRLHLRWCSPASNGTIFVPVRSGRPVVLKKKKRPATQWLALPLPGITVFLGLHGICSVSITISVLRVYGKQCSFGLVIMLFVGALRSKEIKVRENTVFVLVSAAILLGLVHKNRIIRTRLMYHAACKVEFQPFYGCTHSWRFATFIKYSGVLFLVCLRPVMTPYRKWPFFDANYGLTALKPV